MIGQKNSSSRLLSALLFGVAVLFFSTATVETAHSQVVQLPTINVFNVNTTVSVPDGGTMLLGGVRGGSSGSISRGVPGLGSLPYGSRGFRNRAIGNSNFSRQASVNVTIISMREQEAAVMAEAERRMAARSREYNPNGSAETQDRAAFISRNIGRSIGRRR